MADEKFSAERYILTDEKAALALDVLRKRLNRPQANTMFCAQ